MTSEKNIIENSGLTEHKAHEWDYTENTVFCPSSLKESISENINEHTFSQKNIEDRIIEWLSPEKNYVGLDILIPLRINDFLLQTNTIISDYSILENTNGGEPDKSLVFFTDENGRRLCTLVLQAKEDRLKLVLLSIYPHSKD